MVTIERLSWLCLSHAVLTVTYKQRIRAKNEIAG